MECTVHFTAKALLHGPLGRFLSRLRMCPWLVLLPEYDRTIVVKARSITKKKNDVMAVRIMSVPALQSIWFYLTKISQVSNGLLARLVL